MSAEQQEQDEIPFDAVDEVNPDDIGDLSDQKDGADAIEPVRDVQFYIKQDGCSIDTQKNDAGDWTVKRLKVQAVISALGTDGEGKYAGKVFFPDFVLVFNLDALRQMHQEKVDAGKKKDKPFNEAWWKNEARFDFKEFALATGLASMHEEEGGRKTWKMNMALNDNTLAILGSGDVGFIANVVKEKDTFRGEGYFRNQLKRFRAVPQGESE